MSTASLGLSQKDLEILRHYATHDNRELYWNYLAQRPDNDGYGLLALGVVRNDNMPGAIANTYAQNYAMKHSGVSMSEREWDQFGINLMTHDFKLRQKFAASDDHPEYSLNLPVIEVMKIHDRTFESHNIDPNAWTPRKLLEAARQRDLEEQHLIERGEMRREDAENHMESHWSAMLNNGYAGIDRMRSTMMQSAEDRIVSPTEQDGYIGDMVSAYFTARKERSYDFPNIIGKYDHYFIRDRDGGWVEMTTLHTAIGIDHDMKDVTDPAVIQRLEDTRNLRLEREAARKDFHPDDPGQLKDSPHPLSDHRPSSSFPVPGDDPVYAAMRLQLPLGISDDKVAEMAAQARHIGIHNERQLAGVDIEGSQIVCTGVRPGTEIALSMDTLPPPKEQSITLAQNLDQQAFDQAQMREMQQAQQMAMQQSGPSMAL